MKSKQTARASSPTAAGPRQSGFADCQLGLQALAVPRVPDQ